jgi:hypothetical protein
MALVKYLARTLEDQLETDLDTMSLEKNKVETYVVGCVTSAKYVVREYLHGPTNTKELALPSLNVIEQQDASVPWRSRRENAIR